MLIFVELGMQPKDKVDKVRNGIIMDEDELILFDMAIRNKSAQEMAFRINKSPRTIYRMLCKLKSKIILYNSYITEQEKKISCS